MTLSIRNIADSDIATAQNAELGNALRQAREAVGYSIDDLAETCGLTASEISRIELGADEDDGRLRRIAAALQFDLGTVETQ